MKEKRHSVKGNRLLRVTTLQGSGGCLMSMCLGVWAVRRKSETWREDTFMTAPEVDLSEKLFRKFRNANDHQHHPSDLT